MQTFYNVMTTVDDKGRVTAAIVGTVEAKIRPESSFTNKSRRDVYNDWFDTLEEAQEFVEEAKTA